MTTPSAGDLARSPWRWTCPRGHVSIQVNSVRNTDRKFVCKACQQGGNTTGDAHILSAADLVDKQARARADDGSWSGPGAGEVGGNDD